MKYKLSIAIITMNRAAQLRHAIESCASAKLPDETQFVIVDNGSTDNTAEVVEELRSRIQYPIIYRKEKENRGVGGGRNICFDISEGEYMYIFDDDAEIAEECLNTFFPSCLDYLDRNPNVATLTTEVQDDVFGERPLPLAKNYTVDGLPAVYMFHGNTAFIRRSCFSSPLFMNVNYGCEEPPAAMAAMDKGYIGVFNPNVHTVHMPMNKWAGDNMQTFAMRHISNTLMLKKKIYPVVCYPMLWLAYKKRLKNSGIKDKALIKEFKQTRKTFAKTQKGVKKVKLRTVIKAYKLFGLSVF